MPRRHPSKKSADPTRRARAARMAAVQAPLSDGPRRHRRQRGHRRVRRSFAFRDAAAAKTTRRGDGSKRPIATFFADILKGVVRRQRDIDPLVDQQLADGLAARARRFHSARHPAGRRVRADGAARRAGARRPSTSTSTSPTRSSEDEPKVVNGVLDRIAHSCAPTSSKREARDPMTARVTARRERRGADRQRIWRRSPRAFPARCGLKDDCAILAPAARARSSS